MDNHNLGKKGLLKSGIVHKRIFTIKMGIKGFFKWLVNTYPECLMRDIKLCSKCNTFFIDLCQLTFRSDELAEKTKKSPDEKMDFFLKNLISRLNNIILKINPTDTIYVFEDGPNPAIKFQRQRERWFKREHIDNYIIDPIEYKLSDINTDKDELIIAKLDEYFERITHNCKYLRAKRILFSTSYAPGEAEHKYFEVFRGFKKKPFWRPNQTHSIFTTDNDLIFLALQFFDERFFIVRDLETIIDISIFRDLLLYELFQSPHLYQKENRLEAAHEFVSQIPLDLQQHVINDIIALSFIIGNDYLPPIPDFSDSFSFSRLLGSYKKVNEIFFSKIISKNQNENDASFIQLIVKDSICVSSLQTIIHEYFNKPAKNENTNSDQKPNLEINDNKIDIKGSDNKNDAENCSNRDNENNNIIENNENDIKGSDNKNDTENCNNKGNENNNIIENNENDIKRSYGKKDIESSNDSIQKDNENNGININKNDIKNSEGNKKDNYNENNTNNEKPTNNNETSNDDIEERSQHMLRVFNFTWLYYTKGCPSWSYYYPFKYSPKLRTAINFMKQEGPEVFRTAGHDKKTEAMFKIFVLHPVECKESLPWCLYKLKIPPSEISHFWPLGAKNVNDIPIFDLEIMKKYYENEKKQIKQEELKYNRCDPLYKTFNNMNRNQGKRKQAFGKPV